MRSMLSGQEGALKQAHSKGVKEVDVRGVGAAVMIYARLIF